MSASPMSLPLVDGFDALLFDLDGVVYVGPDAVPFAAEAIAAARDRGVSCCFVTNNAARPARQVAEHLNELGVTATADDVVTSPQAAVSLLPGHVADGARVLVIGGMGIVEALEARGYVGFSDALEVEDVTTPLDWRDRGMERGAPFASAHSFFQTGPFRPRNIWGENVVFTGSGTQPGVGVPMVLVSGRLAAERILGHDKNYRSRAWR